MMNLDRRQFLAGCASGALAVMLRGSEARANSPAIKPSATRGVVLVPEDLTLVDWPQRAKDAGLTTIGLHHQNSPQAVIRCVKSDLGQRFLEQCQKLGLEVEYELHAMKELLPRELYGKSPEMFRMDDNRGSSLTAMVNLIFRATLDRAAMPLRSTVCSDPPEMAFRRSRICEVSLNLPR